MSKGVTEIPRKGTKAGEFSLSGHYEIEKVDKELRGRIEALEDRQSTTEFKVLELEKNADARRSNRKHKDNAES